MDHSALLSLPLQSQGELLGQHGIDPSFFESWALEIGPCSAYKIGLENWAVRKNLATRHAQIAERSSNWTSVRNSLARAELGWSISSVLLNQQGFPVAGHAFIGHRIHPSKRLPSDGLKFDTRGWSETNRGVFLPPFSLRAAQELLGPYGFVADPTSYQPWTAWDFILRSPQVVVRVEESALKAMASCSIGQIAVGLNGINGWGQKNRSDRIHPFLSRLAKRKRVILVRFDRPETYKSQSINQASKLAFRLFKHGADVPRWWCWIKNTPAKTDDFVAALIRGELTPEQALWISAYVSGSDSRGPYKRLRKDWAGEKLNREFVPNDLVKILDDRRIVALKGATGTNKTCTMVDGLEALEDCIGTKVVVLGCYHRSSLVHKGSVEFGVVDLSAPKGSPERLGLYEGRILRDGLFCCGESAFKESSEMTLCRWYWELKENPRPAVLILDEISQVLSNWMMGGTEKLRRVRGKALQALEGLIQLQCVRVWAADALIGDIELEWLQSVSGETPYLIQSTFTRQRDLFVGLPNAGNERIVNLQIHSVERRNGCFWLGHGTVAGLHRILDAFPPANESDELRITGEDKRRNDPRVSKFMADTESEGPLYRRVGFSPAVSCGISMAKTPVDLTVVVQDYCWHAEDVLQALNRARVSNLRILLAPLVVPDAAGSTKESDPVRVSKVFEERMRAGELIDYAALIQQRHPATRRLVVELEARRNLEAFNNNWCLRGMLEEEGYRIRDISDLLLEQECSANQIQRQSRNGISAFQGVKAYRMAALQRLSAGTSTLRSEQHLAKKMVEGGTFLDLAEVDVSEEWAVAQELKLNLLIKAGIVHAQSPAMVAVWEALTLLDREGAKKVARLFGSRSDRIPGPMDVLDVRKVWPLVKALGYVPTESSKKLIEGKRVKTWLLEMVPDK